MQDKSPSVAGLDHLELCVSNIYQAAHFYTSVLGFQVADIGAVTETESFARLERSSIQLELVSPRTASSVATDYIRAHGEGVRDIALAVTEVDAFFEKASRLGARRLLSPAIRETAGGRARTAQIGVFGDVVHTLIDRQENATPVGGSNSRTGIMGKPETALSRVDHVALAIAAGELETLADFYSQCFDFNVTHQENVSTEYSGMRSKVVQSPNGRVCFAMMEPASGRKKSQIEHFLEAHQGPGVQHVAFQSHDIIKSVSTLMAAGLSFLPAPHNYYLNLQDRVGGLSDVAALTSFGILADRDPSGILLQIFTGPIGTRSTLFFEIIERRGSAGFGSGNIKALFEAVELAHGSSKT